MSQNIENNTNTVNSEAVDNSKVWKFNGFEAEFDITDVDTAEKYEETFKIMGEKEKALPKAGKQSELLRAQFNWFMETFDMLLGEGAGLKIVGGKKSIALCMEAYDSFLAYVKAQKQGLLDRGQRISNTYSNRAQRRAAAKNKK